MDKGKPKTKTKEYQDKKILKDIGVKQSSTLWYKIVAICFVLSALTFFTFNIAFDNKFVNWDDQVYVEEQPLVLNKQYAQLWKSPVSLNYHPLTMISLAYQVPKDVKKVSPGPFIRTNVFIHIANVVLVFFFIWMISSRKFSVSIFTAAVFAVHPMHVESVVWVSERKDVLYAFFFLLSCISYWQYLVSDKMKWLSFAFLFFMMSVFSKAMAVVLPIVLLLMDYWKGRSESFKKVVLEKVPFLLISLFFGLMAISVQSGNDFGGLLTLVGKKVKAVAETDTFTIWQRFTFASYGFLQYIVKFFYPGGHSAFYPYPDHYTFGGFKNVLFPFVFLAVAATTIWTSFKTKIIAFGVGFYFITIALVLQFLSVGLAIMADRYTYLPYIGLTFSISLLAENWVSKRQPVYKYCWYCLVSFFIIFLTVKTRTQVDVWQDSESLWSQVLVHYPKEDLALSNRGNYRGKMGNIEGALKDFEIAIADGCERADVYEGMGNVYGILSTKDEVKRQEYVGLAIENFRKAVSLDPSNGTIRFNLGVAQLQTNPEGSATALLEALKIAPNLEKDILPVLGLAYVGSGKYDQAVSTLTKSMEISQKTDIKYFHRGLANMGLGNNEAAANDFRQALAINPANIDAKKKLEELN